MLSRRTAAKTILGALAGLALPRGQVAAAAIPADLDRPVTELLSEPEWVMPTKTTLLVCSFLDDDKATAFFVRAEIAVAADGAFEVGFFAGERAGGGRVGGHAGGGQEPAGAILSILCHGMKVAGELAKEAFEATIA